MGPRLAFISPLAERCDNNNKWERDVEKKKKILCSSNGDNEGCLLLLCGVCYICSADESLNSFYVGLVCSSLFQTLGSRLARLQVPPTPVMTSRDPNQREFFQLLRLMKWNITVYFEYHRVQTLLWCHQVSPVVFQSTLQVELWRPPWKTTDILHSQWYLC